MLKISKVAPVKHIIVLRLEGRVIGPWVTELKKSCEDVLSEGRLLKLHLADVEFMDAREWGCFPASFAGASRYWNVRRLRQNN